MHIILKVWAKVSGGYEKLMESSPFSFVRNFSFPDWGVINPGL
jgi:hypothetical protein